MAVYSVANCFENFIATQILREIRYGSKNAILIVSKPLNFKFGGLTTDAYSQTSLLTKYS